MESITIFDCWKKKKSPQNYLSSRISQIRDVEFINTIIYVSYQMVILWKDTGEKY